MSQNSAFQGEKTSYFPLTRGVATHSPQLRYWKRVDYRKLKIKRFKICSRKEVKNWCGRDSIVETALQSVIKFWSKKLQKIGHKISVGHKKGLSALQTVNRNF